MRVASMLAPSLINDVRATLAAFTSWLDAYGETSYDHQSFFAGPIGGAAKGLYYRHRRLGMLAVAPMIAFEAFVPAARRLFWKRQRLPIADAHYAMGFAFLAKGADRQLHYRRAVHFLQVLIDTRSATCARYTWGYPFDWVTVTGTLKSGTPLITTVPYVYEAFEQVYRLDSDGRWLEVMKSIAEHVLRDYLEYPTSPDAASCSYTPPPADNEGVINASAYRAFLLTKAARDLSEGRYGEAAERNLNFVLQSQNPNGSWYYAMDEQRDFVDHFHTCFVLKALAKIQALTGDSRCADAVERGVDYYVRNLFDSQRLPKPFSRRPRLTVYRRELYDYAECVNLGVLLQGRFPELDANLTATVEDLQRRWKKRDGSFRGRQLLLGWDNVPMHRWAQAQMFRSLSFLIDANAPA
jgi:hypothetical protein